LRSALLLALAGCGWLPSDTPAKKPVAVDPQLAELAHTWVVANHVLAGNSPLTDAEARENDGRKVEITPTTYRSPFTGSCDDAARTRHDRVFADLLAELDLAGEARQTAIHFGFGDPITEYRMSCPGNNRALPLVIYISGKRAMTCFGGACYLLSR
jgi:hypothetical protein